MYDMYPEWGPGRHRFDEPGTTRDAIVEAVDASYATVVSKLPKSRRPV